MQLWRLHPRSPITQLDSSLYTPPRQEELDKRIDEVYRIGTSNIDHANLRVVHPQPATFCR